MDLGRQGAETGRIHPSNRPPERADGPPAGSYVPPAVDIYEEPDGLVLLADMPGVASAGLDVRLDRDTLTILGQPSKDDPGEPRHREWKAEDYYRAFTLGDVIDRSKITADLKDGVLIVRLPKAAEAKPRKIQVRSE